MRDFDKYKDKIFGMWKVICEDIENKYYLTCESTCIHKVHKKIRKDHIDNNNFKKTCDLCENEKSIKIKLEKANNKENYKNKLVGQIFGRWKVLKFSRTVNKNKQLWLCECMCENNTIKEVYRDHLVSSKSKSCGCLQKEIMFNILKKYNIYDLTGEYGVGYSSNTNKNFYFDLEDYDKIKNYCWSSDSNGYLFSNTGENRIRLHNLILGEKDGFIIDHINGDKLNNRKTNLRFATHKENMINRKISKNNTTGYIGVYISKKMEYKSRIGVDRKTIQLGTFDNIEEAITSRLKAELKYFGRDFAPQRDLFEEYGIGCDFNEK